MSDNGNVDQQVLTPNEEATMHSHEFGNKSPVSQARKDLYKRPAYVLASQEELESYKKLFELFFEVLVYFGVSLIHGFPNGVFVGVIKPYGKGRSLSKGHAFFIHVAETNPNIVSEIEAQLKPVAKTINREMIENMITYAIEMKKHDEYTEVDEDELNVLLSNSLNRNEAAAQFMKLETGMVADPECFASLRMKNYDKELHYGVLLDTPRMIRKYGEYAVGINRYAILGLLSDDFVESRSDFNSQANDATLNLILRAWKMEGFLLKTTEIKRLNEKIFNLNEAGEDERLYIVQSKKLYEAWNEYMKEEGIDNE